MQKTRTSPKPGSTIHSVVMACMALCVPALSLAAQTEASPADQELRTAPLQATGRSGTFVAARLIDSRPPQFPAGAFVMEQDALVRHRICISTEGLPESVELLPEGFHTPAHVREADRYVRSMVFEPATIDGQPVQSCVILPMTFAFTRHHDEQFRRGMTPEFRRELDKVTKLVKAGDLAGAHHHTDQMLRDKVKLLFEYAALQARLADTYARAGNPHRAIEMARNASMRRGSPFPKLSPGDKLPANDIEQYLLPREWIFELLNMRMRLAASSGLLAEALHAYYELASLSRTRPDPELARHGQILEQALETGERLSGKIVTGETGIWRHPLLYTEFTVADVKGHMNGMDLVCGPQVRELAYVPDVEWRVPATWRDCALNIHAEPGTALTVVEFPPAQ